MLQRVLAEPWWMAGLTQTDRISLTSLLWGRVSPKGAFYLKMAIWLDLDVRTPSEPDALHKGHPVTSALRCRR